MKKDIIVIGAGGHAVSIANVALSDNYTISGFVDDNKKGGELLGAPIINMEKCVRDYADANYVIAIGDNSTRKKVSMDIKRKFPNAKFPALIHQSADIGIYSEVGEGTVIMPQAVIGPNSIVGHFCIINTRSSLDHDCHLGDFGSIAPGVTAGGNVKIGASSAVSIGATIKHSVTIGHDSVIGASSYVNSDIGDNVVAHGIPCKIIRRRQSHDPYLS